jgi:hypothetical protein
MATLSFDGTDDYVHGTAPGGLAGAQTVAALIKRSSVASAQSIVSTGAGSAGYSFFMNAHGTEPRPEIYNDNAGNQTSPPATGWGSLGTDLLLVGFTRGSGETPRFHAKNITTSGAWKHDNGESAQTSNPDAATTFIDVGRFTFPGIGNFDFFNGAIGLLGVWDGIEMTDGEFEALATNLATSDWHTHTAGAPASLTEFTSTSPTDLESLVTWTVNGATATGDAMALWDFDGIGGGGGPGTPGADIYVKVGGAMVASPIKARVGGAWV